MVRIPKIIHIIWIGKIEFPYKNNLNSYKKNNPKWKIIFWDNKNIPDIFNRKSYQKMNSYASKVDILRLEILYNYGGIYVDADSKCLKSLDILLDELTCFGMTGNNGNIANGTLGCMQKHSAFKELVFGLDSHIEKLSKLKLNKKKGIRIFNVAGTGYITRILRKYDDFIQIDKGCKKGNRRYIGTFEDKKVLKNGYIVHFNKKTWKKKKRIIL